MENKPDWMRPDWPAPQRVCAASTLRSGGASQRPYAGLNLGTHVGDDPVAVAQNRNMLKESLALPGEPVWLKQVHGTRVVDAAVCRPDQEEADASMTTHSNTVCVVMTADCLPVLFCDRDGTCVAAAHAGWRGLAAGVLEITVQNMNRPTGDLLAWLGPAIGANAYEVGEDVYATFVAQDTRAEQAFRPVRTGHWRVDMYALARLRLQGIGLNAVYGGDHCTYTNAERFYSYRRDNVTGRMASLIWLADT